MEEFATSSVETGKCQCLEDGVEPHEHLHIDYMGSSDRGRCDLSNQRDDGSAEHSLVYLDSVQQIRAASFGLRKEQDTRTMRRSQAHVVRKANASLLYRSRGRGEARTDS
jgi:hypothetical protein